jgi:hypothetical protein
MQRGQFATTALITRGKFPPMILRISASEFPPLRSAAGVLGFLIRPLSPEADRERRQDPRGLPKYAEVVQDIASCGSGCGLEKFGLRDTRTIYSAGREWCSCITRHRPSIFRKHMVNRNSSSSRLPPGSKPAHRPIAVAKATSIPAVTFTS